MVISMGGCALPLLLQYCSSSFFQATGVPFKASVSFNFSLQFSDCRRLAVQKYALQSSRTVAVRHLNWHHPAIFRLQYGFSLFRRSDRLCAPARRPEENRSASYVSLEGGRLAWRAPERGPMEPPSVPQLQENGVQQGLSGTISWQIYKIAQKSCIFPCIIWYMMFLQILNFSENPQCVTIF
jgi:hypothetical protein